MKQIKVKAKVENLRTVQDFIDYELEAAGCGLKEQLQIDIAVEEIFVNICSYAYAQTDNDGEAVINIETSGPPPVCEITFEDWGTPYDPLARRDPDITLPAVKRSIGGLGIFMVKKSMDDISYEYRDGKNRLTIRKII